MSRNYPHIFFLLLLALVTVLFVGLIKEYLLAIFWAVVLALLFHNWYDYFIVKVKGKRNVAAAITILLILLVVIIPVLLIGSLVVNEGVDLYHSMESGEFHVQERFDDLRQQLPSAEGLLNRLNFDVEQLRHSVNEGMASITRNLTGYLFGFTQNAISFIVQFGIMLYILFFFIRDGSSLVDKLVWVLPIGDQKEWALIRRFESVAKATVRGSLVVAILQGTIGGILFYFVGVPAAVLWGVIMTFASLLPMGSGIIWLPTAIIYIFQGDYSSGIIIIAVGSLIIGLLDNILRPRLVGSDTKMPDYLILLSTLGGLSWVGVSGFVLGPIIAALFISIWEMLGVGIAND